MNNRYHFMINLILIFCFFILNVKNSIGGPISPQKIYFPSKIDNLDIDSLPDYSTCGFQSGRSDLPEVEVKKTINARRGNHFDIIQNAIDEVSKMAINKDGFRGAILIKKGKYFINKPINIYHSGIVLTGEGDHENGTVLIATKKVKAASLINIRGKPCHNINTGFKTKIIGPNIIAGSKTFNVQKVGNLSIGQRIIVRRHGNSRWINAIGMDSIIERPYNPKQSVEWNKKWITKQWEPFDLDFDRVIVDIKGNKITVDSPITIGIEDRWGGGEIISKKFSGEINNIIIKNLMGLSEFDKSKVEQKYGKKHYADENHVWSFIKIFKADNVWIDHVVARFFAMSLVDIGLYTKWVTVSNSKCYDMVSKIEGDRRYPFFIRGGQLCLIKNCYANTARRPFSFGPKVCGPNVFYNCTSGDDLSYSEPHHRWSVGGLYDNVKSPISIQDRGYLGTGHGWGGANYIVWNCEGKLIVQTPPTAFTLVVGHIGRIMQGIHKDRKSASFFSYGTKVEPISLYLYQVNKRLTK